MGKKTTRERWETLLESVGWTGRIPPGTDPKIVREANDAMHKAQAAARANDWTVAEIQVRTAVVLLQRPGTRDEPPRSTAPEYVPPPREPDPPGWDAAAARTLITETIKAVESAPAFGDNEEAVRCYAAMDDAFVARSIEALREACEEFRRVVLG